VSSPPPPTIVNEELGRVKVMLSNVPLPLAMVRLPPPASMSRIWSAPAVAVNIASAAVPVFAIG